MGGTGLIAEEFLRLRHRMIPFLYSASYENTDNGLALIEPMYYAYPEKSEAYECPDQYLHTARHPYNLTCVRQCHGSTRCIRRCWRWR